MHTAILQKSSLHVQNSRFKTITHAKLLLCLCLTSHHQLRSYGDERRLKVSSDRLVKPTVEPASPGLEGEQLIHYPTAAPFTYTKCVCTCGRDQLNQAVPKGANYESNFRNNVFIFQELGKNTQIHVNILPFL